MAQANQSSTKDLMYFKEEMLGEMKQLEKGVRDKLDLTTKKYDPRFESYDLKFADLTTRISQLNNELANAKAQNEKIETLGIKLDKLDHSLQVDNARIKEVKKDINNACNKYDNIIENNLLVPGIIGENCKYPTMRNYIETTTNQLASLILYKDKQTIDFKGYKDKLEGIVKAFNSQIDKIQNSFLEYCSQSVNDCEKKFSERCKTTEEMIQHLRMENCKYSWDLKKETEKLNIQWDKLENMKNEIYAKWAEDVQEFRKINEKTLNGVDDSKQEFKVIKERFTELSEFIKDIRFRRNLGVDVKKKDLKWLSNHINFDKKQKILTTNDDDLKDDSLNKSVQDNEKATKEINKALSNSPTTSPIQRQRKHRESAQLCNVPIIQVQEWINKHKEKEVKKKKWMQVDYPMINWDSVESNVKKYINNEHQELSPLDVKRRSSNDVKYKEVLKEVIDMDEHVNGNANNEIMLKEDSIDNGNDFINSNLKANINNDQDWPETQPQPNWVEVKIHNKITKSKEMNCKGSSKNQSDIMKQNKENEIENNVEDITEKDNLKEQGAEKAPTKCFSPISRCSHTGNQTGKIINAKKKSIITIQNPMSNTTGTHNIWSDHQYKVAIPKDSKNKLFIPPDHNITEPVQDRIVQTPFTSSPIKGGVGSIQKRLQQTELRLIKLETKTNIKLDEIMTLLKEWMLKNKISISELPASRNEQRKTTVNLKQSFVSGTMGTNNDETNDNNINNYYLDTSRSNAHFRNNSHNLNYNSTGSYFHGKKVTIKKSFEIENKKAKEPPHFSHWNVMFTNNPKYAPNDDSNTWWRNIEPFLIKKFDD